MGRDEDDRLGRPDGPEVLEFGTTRWRARRWPGGRWPGGRWPGGRWPAGLAVGALAVVLAGAAVGYGLRPHNRPRGDRPAGQAARSAVQVTETGHRLLGMRPGWDLLGLGPAGLVDIQPGRGRIIKTAVRLDSTGPVSLVAGPGQAVVRPLDFVPGYLVPAGQPPRRLPAPLSGGGVVVVPGPWAGLVWIVAAERHQMSLYSLATRATVLSVPLPRDAGWQASPDGRGEVRLQIGGSAYDAGPGGVRAVTTGMVAAVGPAGWLVVQCRTGGPCANVLINPATGMQRPLPGHVVATDGSAGVISPDGAAAALFASGAGEHDLLQLVDLASGRITTLPVTVQGPLGSRALAWSPDSRWLFTVADNGQLRAIDTTTGRVHRLGVTLPPVIALARGQESAGP